MAGPDSGETRMRGGDLAIEAIPHLQITDTTTIADCRVEMDRLG